MRKYIKDNENNMKLKKVQEFIIDFFIITCENIFVACTGKLYKFILLSCLNILWSNVKYIIIILFLQLHIDFFLFILFIVTCKKVIIMC